MRHHVRASSGRGWHRISGESSRDLLSEHLTVVVTERERTSALAYPATDASGGRATLVLAHGAGAAQQSGFMVAFARALAARGIDVLTFNFLYTEQRRRLPDRPDKLEACYRGAIAVAREHFRRDRVFVGGKSMGGRIATHLAAEDAAGLGIAGVVLLGYPLHPPGKSQQLRVAHLPRITVPMLIVQGSRDAFGTPDELRPVIGTIPAHVTLHVVEGGDHSLAPPKRGGAAVELVHAAVQDTIAAWITGVAT